jgi:predicted transcriptional regulator
MPTLTFKEEAKQLIESLPEDSDWNDLMYEIYVRKEIERGIADIESGRFKDHEEVKKLFDAGE